jgi:hypothetical protein
VAQQLTYRELGAMLCGCDTAASSWHRRHTLLALTELAAKAKGTHDPQSRWRLKRFREALAAMEGDDEVEVTGEALCETLMLAMNALEAR